jgi:hypothetical protein
MEQSSTDKRIDDLSDRVGRFEAHVDRRFDRVDRRFERFEDKVDARFEKVDAQFEKVDAGFKTVASKEDVLAINKRLDRWGKTVTGGVVAIAVSVILKVLGV